MHAGIKFIPLRTPGGELIPGSGLFVKIKKEVSRVTIGNKNSGHDLNARQEITKRHLISRQVGFDFEDGAGNATEVDEEGDINEKEDFEVNRSPGKLEGRDSIQRHFSSPALLEHPGVLFNKNNNLTISVEVHEDITAI